MMELVVQTRQLMLFSHTLLGRSELNPASNYTVWLGPPKSYFLKFRRYRHFSKSYFLLKNFLGRMWYQQKYARKCHLNVTKADNQRGGEML